MFEFDKTALLEHDVFKLIKIISLVKPHDTHPSLPWCSFAGTSLKKLLMLMNKLIAGMHQAAGVSESCVSISPPLDNQFTVIDSRFPGGQTVIIAHVHTCHHQVKPTPQLEHPTLPPSSV